MTSESRLLIQSELVAGGTTEEAEVEGYLQRISDGILREDRREALAQLRDLLYDNVQVSLKLIRSFHIVPADAQYT